MGTQGWWREDGGMDVVAIYYLRDISMGLYSCIAVTCVVRIHTTDGCVMYWIYPSLFRFKSQFLEPIPSAISEITDITM